MKNYFLDTEFEEAHGRDIMPISLALVAEHGPELYIEFWHNEHRALRNAFVRQNVLPHLRGQEQYTKEDAARAICDFLRIGPKHPAESKPEPFRIWAYFASTDWVVFYSVFGTMLDLPEGCPRYPMCLQQLYSTLGSPKGLKPPKPTKAHDALADAVWNREFYRNMARYIWNHDLEDHINIPEIDDE
jgi:hypothetical protein